MNDSRYERQQHQAKMDRLWEDFSNTLGKVIDKMAGVETPEVIEEKEAANLGDVVVDVITPKEVEEEYVSPKVVVREQTTAEMYASTTVSNKTAKELMTERFDKKFDEAFQVEYTPKEMYEQRKQEIRDNLVVVGGSADQMEECLSEASEELQNAVESINKPIVLSNLRTTEFRAEEIKKKYSPTMKMIRKIISESTKPTPNYVPDTTKYVEVKEPKVVTPNKDEEESLVDNTAECNAVLEAQKQHKKNLVDKAFEEHKAKKSVIDTEPTFSDLLNVEEAVDYFTPDTPPPYTSGYME